MTNKSINLCLDTNIYLSFYHFSDNALEKLEEIIVLIESGELNIILPEQIKSEFIRNREIKIGDALRRLKEERLDFQLPKLVDAYEEVNELSIIFKSYKEKKQALIAKLEVDIEENSLKADILINNIFDKSIYMPLTPEIRNKAKRRFDLGNPPGKDRSYGDSVIRETLLAYGKNEDINFVSIDGDYLCALNRDKLNNFLQTERNNKNRGYQIFFYGGLNLFFQKNFPKIKIDEEYLKDKYVESFEKSYNFDNARANLLKLVKFQDYSLDQINRIIDASLTNNQIYLAQDYTPRLGEYLSRLIEPYRNEISYSKRGEFFEIYDFPKYEDMMHNEYLAVQAETRTPQEDYNLKK